MLLRVKTDDRVVLFFDYCVVVGINDGIQRLQKLRNYNPVSTYHVVGKFGICTHNKSIDGDILYTSNYNYLRKARVDKVIASIQAIHRKNLMK